MKKYIDVDRLLDDFNNTKLYKLTSQFERIIRDQPIADVQEVKHAEWHPISGGIYGWRCNSCGKSVYSPRKEDVERYKYAYCPHCGAKMNGGDGE